MMIKKRRVALATAAIMFMGIAGVVQAAASVRIATNSPYRPMEYTRPDGKLVGFDIDLGNALCKQAQLECSWTDQSWNGIIPGLLARKYDAIMSAMTISPARKKHVLFSNTYLVVPSAFFVPKDSSLQKVTDATLKGQSIGVQRGTTQDRYVTDHFGSVATIKRYQNADDLAADMAAGRLDATFLTRITGEQTLIEPNPGKYREVGKPRLQSHMGIAFRKNEQALAEKFNAALKVLKSNGTFDKIYARYFQAGTDQGQ